MSSESETINPKPNTFYLFALHPTPYNTAADHCTAESPRACRLSSTSVEYMI